MTINIKNLNMEHCVTMDTCLFLPSLDIWKTNFHYKNENITWKTNFHYKIISNLINYYKIIFSIFNMLINTFFNMYE